MRDLYKAYGIDTSSAPAFHATSSLLSAEQRVELMHRQAELGRGSKSPAAQSDEMKAFADRIAEHKADQDARIAAQEAAPRTEAPAAKNFTVDDEIEAREAKFEATVEEYNAHAGRHWHTNKIGVPGLKTNLGRLLVRTPRGATCFTHDRRDRLQDT